jgi:hypothetical protein
VNSSVFRGNVFYTTHKTALPNCPKERNFWLKKSPVDSSWQVFVLGRVTGGMQSWFGEQGEII